MEKCERGQSWNTDAVRDEVMEEFVPTVSA